MAARVTGISALVQQLQALGVEVQDLKGPFARLAARGAALAANYAPERSGRLRKSIRGSRAKNKAVVTAGNRTRVKYAGVQNYGWKRRNIKPRHFMQRASRALEPTAISLIEFELNRLIRRSGLN